MLDQTQLVLWRGEKRNIAIGEKLVDQSTKPFPVYFVAWEQSSPRSWAELKCSFKRMSKLKLKSYGVHTNLKNVAIERMSFDCQIAVELS